MMVDESMAEIAEEREREMASRVRRKSFASLVAAFLFVLDRCVGPASWEAIQ